MGVAVQPAPVVRRVDHVVISSPDPGRLFAVLTDTLGLPVAWPMSDYGAFASGGTFAGNVNVETLRFGPPPPAPGPAPAAAWFGIVLEPADGADVVGALRARGLEPGPPEDQVREIGGRPVRFWTNVTLGALSRDAYLVYTVDYAPQARAALAAVGSRSAPPLGVLGVLSMTEVAVGTREPEALARAWSRLLGPPAAADSPSFPAGPGPTIRLVAREREEIAGVVLRVASLARARAALAERGLLGEAGPARVTIAPGAVQGLAIALVE